MNAQQQLLLDAYKDITNILEENNIRFYVMFGTAIGTLRHNGIIPWDDDIDIMVFADNLDKMNEVLKKELDQDKYYYHNPSADTHPHIIIKTPDYDKELKEHRASFIDIFILINHPVSIVRRMLLYPFIGFELLSHKIIENTDSHFIQESFYKLMYTSRKLIRVYSEPDTPRCCIRSPEIRKHTFLKEDFGEPEWHIFEDIEVPLPHNCRKILADYYGDYMTPPPENKRTGAGSYPYSLLKDYEEDQHPEGNKHHRLTRSDLPL